MEKIVPSICRNCLAFCPILVTVRDGRAVKVTGDPASSLYEGYSCPKGRALPEQHNDPARLLHCLRRGDGGRFEPAASDTLIPEIATKLEAIIAQHGPRSVAAYIGTGVVAHPTGATMMAAYFRAIGSPMVFSASTIDKPAANISTALHGNWIAGAQSFASSDTWILVGANPVISKSNGVPYNNPGSRLKEATKRGMKLIVIDPRRTETAKRAHIHLQPRPGEDPSILAAMINVILREKLFDAEFVSRHAQGLDALEKATAPFTPELAAERAGISTHDLVEAARTFARGKRGGVVCSTGPSFSTHSNLTFYLALCLNTLCGRWAREGDRAAFANTMLPAFTPKAQAYPPYPVFGTEAMRVRGLKANASGMPTAALADEILTEGPGQVRALICLGGNPMMAWPDQARTSAALSKLELLVVLDCRMTATAEFADYIIPSPLTLEVPGATYFVEWLKYIGVSRGFEVPWAQYSPRIVDPPAGADVIDDRAFFFRLAQQMKLQLEWVDQYGYGPHVESPAKRVMLDMARLPSVDELIDITCGDGRVPLHEVKKYPHGRLFEEAAVPVAPADPDCDARLELGASMMMSELADVLAEGAAAAPAGFPFSLTSRRENNYMNSLGQEMTSLNRGRLENPVYVNPHDLLKLGISDGEVINIRSAHATIVARVEPDSSMRRGVVAIAQGSVPQSKPSHSSVTRLISLDECDPITGIPRMSAVPVAIEKVQLAG